jgi:hypothetical protein
LFRADYLKGELTLPLEKIPLLTPLVLGDDYRTNIMFVKSVTMDNDGHEEE